MTKNRFALPSFLVLLMACGGSTTPSAAPVDAGVADSAPVDPNAPVELFSFRDLDYAEVITLDDQYVYAAIFTPPTGLDDLCSPMSSWVRIAKDGSGHTKLGDASSCDSNNTTAVFIGDSLYWLATANNGPNMAPTTTVMTMPKSGGAAMRIASFDHRYVAGLGTDGMSLFAVEDGDSSQLPIPSSSIIRIELDGHRRRSNASSRGT